MAHNFLLLPARQTVNIHHHMGVKGSFQVMQWNLKNNFSWGSFSSLLRLIPSRCFRVGQTVIWIITGQRRSTSGTRIKSAEVNMKISGIDLQNKSFGAVNRIWEGVIRGVWSCFANYLIFQEANAFGCTWKHVTTPYNYILKARCFKNFTILYLFWNPRSGTIFFNFTQHTSRRSVQSLQTMDSSGDGSRWGWGESDPQWGD